MRAILCERWCDYRDLTVTNIAPPRLNAGQVRIAVKFATVGYGQMLIVAGQYQRKPPLPFVPGTEVAGIVTEVADDVTGFAVGDRVVAALDWGGYAEEAVATALTTWHVPDGVDLAAAVSVPLGYGTSYAALHWRGRIKAGDTLAVFGAAGGVGMTAVQLGRLAGARVIAVAGTQERVERAIAKGADAGLVHGVDDLGKRIKALNSGRGVDLVYDPVGGRLFDEGLRCIGPEGRILVIGFASGNVPAIPANILLVKNVEVIGFNFGLYIGWGLTDERAFYAGRVRDMMTTLFAHVAAGELVPETGERYRLDDFVDAFDAIKERRAVGRVIMEIGREETP
jgi:NADPH:quinone reductase